jgi:uncharacterized membrane protein
VSEPVEASARLDRAWRLTLAGAALVAVPVTVAALRSAPWPTSLPWLAVLLSPLVLPLRGLWRHNRRTCAWATLCVAPYFAYGATEVIANPAVRNVAGAILFASLAWFVSLVHCLRVSRPASAPRPTGHDPSAG